MAPSTTTLLTGGGRTRARRLLALAGLFVSAGMTVAASSPSAPKVSVIKENGTYRVAATFTVPQSASVVMNVLTDYERIPRFMPDVRTSRLLERRDADAVIEQEAVARFMMFSKRIHLVLEVHEAPGVLRFRDRCGASFTRYEGAWSVTEVGGQTVVVYELVAQPAFDVPQFLLKRLLKRDSTKMIEMLQVEIAARR